MKVCPKKEAPYKNLYSIDNGRVRYRKKDLTKYNRIPIDIAKHKKVKLHKKYEAYMKNVHKVTENIEKLNEKELDFHCLCFNSNLELHNHLKNMGKN